MTAGETHLIGVLELEAGDDLTLQLAVGHRLGQDRLAELRDVGFAGLPQHWVQSVICSHKNTLMIENQLWKTLSCNLLFLLSSLSFYPSITVAFIISQLYWTSVKANL